MPSSMRNEAMAQEQAVHEQPVHAVEKNVVEENKETKQSSWWSLWGKSRVSDQVSARVVLSLYLFCLMFIRYEKQLSSTLHAILHSLAEEFIPL